MHPLLAALFFPALAVFAYARGRSKILAQIEHSGGVAQAHALPGYYGAYVALWTVGPVLLLYLIWSVLSDNIILEQVVADLAPEERRGTAFGWFNLIAGITLLPASVVFGGLYQGASPLVAFSFSGSCAVLAALLLMFWVRVPARRA